MDKIKMIKPDAIIDIKIGTGFLQQIQHLLMFLAKDLKPEQLEQYKKKLMKNYFYRRMDVSCYHCIYFIKRNRN